jgi:hypothetical protein
VNLLMNLVPKLRLGTHALRSSASRLAAVFVADWFTGSRASRSVRSQAELGNEGNLAAEKTRVGYDLHITRADYWAENEGQEITRDEWFALVTSDPELNFDPVNGNAYALWNGQCEHAEPWFNWWRGNISTKYPDGAMIVKMIQMAGRLGARVQGDDGEEYKGPVGGKLVLVFNCVIVGEIVDAYWTDRHGNGVFQHAPGKHDDPAMRRFWEYFAFSRVHHARAVADEKTEQANWTAFADVRNSDLWPVTDQSGIFARIGSVDFIGESIFWTPVKTDMR